MNPGSFSDGQRPALFGPELEMLTWIHARQKEGGGSMVTPGCFHRLSQAHQEVVDTLVRVTRVSDLAQRQLVRDRSQLRQALHAARDSNQQLASRNSEKDEVLALAAHDLRSPMATIQGLAEAIDSQLPENAGPEIRGFVKEIDRISGEMIEMVSTLLEVYRAEQGGLVPKPEPAALLSLQSALVESWHTAAEMKRSKLRWEMAGAQSAFLLDVNLFRRVADNLISNALKYSPPGSRIGISLEYEAGVLEFEVRDAGPGISEEDRKTLFTPFMRTTSVPTGGESSAGVGLALVERIVQILGGTVEYQPREPRGSTFRVEIPCPAA